MQQPLGEIQVRQTCLPALHRKARTKSDMGMNLDPTYRLLIAASLADVTSVKSLVAVILSRRRGVTSLAGMGVGVGVLLSRITVASGWLVHLMLLLLLQLLLSSVVCCPCLVLVPLPVVLTVNPCVLTLLLATGILRRQFKSQWRARKRRTLEP